ncbi:MAG: sensor histidine kinase [Gammaproteobacteria bacterium]
MNTHLPIWLNHPLKLTLWAVLLSELVYGLLHALLDLDLAAGFLVAFVIPVAGILPLSWLLDRVMAQLNAKHAALATEHEHLHRISEDKTRLLSVIAHDLRGPVANLKSALDLLHAGAMSTEELRDMAGELCHQTAHTLDMMDNTLRWAASQMKGIEPEIKTVALDGLIRGLAETYAPMAAAKSVRIRIAGQRGLAAQADPDMLHAVLRNLLSNAVKFSEPDQIISLTANMEAGGRLRVAVTDQGVGMDPEALRHALNPERFNTQRGTAKEKGTGIGLSLCVRFAKAMGLEMEAVSGIGQGSQFALTWPADRSYAGHGRMHRRAEQQPRRRYRRQPDPAALPCQS